MLPVNVTIHPSQFPENVRKDLLESLRRRRVNHKFHYDSVKQTAQWLRLHQAYSPSRTDPDCARTYDEAFKEAAARVSRTRVDLIGLGCGGGQKDSRMLGLLRGHGKAVRYLACDVSLAMVLEARRAALGAIPDLDGRALVCDLAETHDLSSTIEIVLPGTPQAAGDQGATASNPARLFTFFGMLPNFPSKTIVPRLAQSVRSSDYLLLSANLSPGRDYWEGVKKVLPLYDNPLTREWLMTFLLDLGVERGDGEIEFHIEPDSNDSKLLRIAAYFVFKRSCEITVEMQRLNFAAGETILLFFSLRHTPELVTAMLKEHGLELNAQWVTQSGEEGVFLISRAL